MPEEDKISAMAEMKKLGAGMVGRYFANVGKAPTYSKPEYAVPIARTKDAISIITGDNETSTLNLDMWHT